MLCVTIFCFGLLQLCKFGSSKTAAWWGCPGCCLECCRKAGKKTWVAGTEGSICYSPPAHCPPLFRGNQARRLTLQRLYGPRALQERQAKAKKVKKWGEKRRLRPCEVLGRRRWRRRARVSIRYIAAHLIRRDLKCRLEIDPTRAEQRQTSLSFLERQWWSEPNDGYWDWVVFCNWTKFF